MRVSLQTRLSAHAHLVHRAQVRAVLPLAAAIAVQVPAGIISEKEGVGARKPKVAVATDGRFRSRWQIKIGQNSSQNANLLQADCY